MAKISGSWKFHGNQLFYDKNITQDVKFTSVDYETYTLTDFDKIKLTWEQNEGMDEYWISYSSFATGRELFIISGARDLMSPWPESAIINFGPVEQEVSEEFLTMIHALCDPVPVLRGKYVVSTKNFDKLSGYYDYDDSNFLDGGCYVSYTNATGTVFNTIERADFTDVFGTHCRVFLAGCSFEESLVFSSQGYTEKDWKFLDFGENGQGVDEDLYNSTITHILFPYEDGAFVDTAGLASIINGVRSQTTTQLNNIASEALPKVVALVPFNSSLDTKSYTISSTYKDYDTIFLIGSDQASAETPMFLTISTQNIPLGGTIRVEAPGVTYTTRFNLVRDTAGAITITAALCYNQSAAQQSTTGYIKGVYIMKIGG